MQRGSRLRYGSRMKPASGSKEPSPANGPGVEPARAHHVIRAANGAVSSAQPVLPVARRLGWGPLPVSRCAVTAFHRLRSAIHSTILVLLFATASLAENYRVPNVVMDQVSGVSGHFLFVAHLKRLFRAYRAGESHRRLQASRAARQASRTTSVYLPQGRYKLRFVSTR